MTIRHLPTVREFMDKYVDTLSPETDIMEAVNFLHYVAGLFMTERFRRFPVVEDGRIVGAITRFDVLRAVKRGLAGIAPNRASGVEFLAGV
jgi:CBS domain-containing protein